ncbi:MAG: hypothetical protein N3F66_08940 [Spirochaetes bacterium]|nr:hypothetical protein [Spirochaetota bacterium]
MQFYNSIKKILAYMVVCCFSVQPVFSQNADTQSYRTMNIDMQVVYGQYNDMLSTVNLSQEQEGFVYLLRTYLKKSNDYGYKNEIFKNTSYYQNRIGFTGNITASETWKSIFDINVHNDSYGMADNPVFSREEKDNVIADWKNIVKYSPSFEMFYVIGGAQYYHRLTGTTTEGEESRVYQGHGQIGGEYIWSASNRFKYSSTFYGYKYEKYQNDFFCNNEIVDDFNITKDIGVTIGINADFNRDDHWLVGPILGTSYKGFSNSTIVLQYSYFMQPFKPEELYLQQKFITPIYNLEPARVHRGLVKIDSKMNSFLTVQLLSQTEHSTNFYNYVTVPGDVLTAKGIESWIFTNSINLAINVVPKLLAVDAQYKYSYYNASENITYRPQHLLAMAITYNGTKWKVNLSHDIAGSVYTSPQEDTKLKSRVVGYLDLQRKMLEGFFAYIRVENLYNNRYYLRENYPESGIKGLFGIRILL